MSVSIFGRSASVGDFSERKPLARKGAKGKYPPGPLFLLKTNLLNEEYTAKCKAGEQRN